MTALASWVGRDSNGDSSLYIATDSRLSSVRPDGSIGEPYNDSYQKTFYSEQTPDIFGIYGVVTHAPAILGQLFPRLRAIRLSLAVGSHPENEYTEKLRSEIERCNISHTAQEQRFSIVHGMRFEKTHFSVARYETVVCPSGIAAVSRLIPMPSKAGFHCSWGSGGDVIDAVRRDDTDDAKGFSRWQWQTFCDAVASRGDPLSSGAPQLVGLYREGNGQTLGVFFRGAPYLFGRPVSKTDKFKEEFRDETFQRVDPAGTLLPRAQRQARNNAKAVFTAFKL